MKITKSRLKQIIEEELQDLNEALEDEPGWDFLKPGRDPAQAFRTHVARHQDVEPKQARSGREIAAELGYEEEPDVMSQAAAGDINMLQAFEEILELTGRNKEDLSMELRRLAELVAKDPNITHEEEPE